MTLPDRDDEVDGDGDDDRNDYDDGDGGDGDGDWDQDLLSMLSVLWVSSLTSPLLSSL